MNKLYIIAVLLMGYTSIQGQITEMIVHETGGNTVTFQLADIDSITYDTTPIPTCQATITDSRDGEVYCIVTIGNQTWMAENLRYDVPGSQTLDTINPSAPLNYGRLYDWATVMNGASSSSSSPSGVQGICPVGWHIPSDTEWSILEINLGMNPSDSTAGGYRGSHGTGLKSTSGWDSSGNGTNSSGFNSFPAGWYVSGSYVLGNRAYHWSSTLLGGPFARLLSSTSSGMGRYNLVNTAGASCRCVKD